MALTQRLTSQGQRFGLGVWTSPRSQVLHADLASADTREQLSCLQGLRGRSLLEGLIDGGEPEALFVGKVVAGALGAITLDERRGSEVLQAGAGGRQGLASSLVTCRCVHEERVANPETAPAHRALWDGDILAVDGNGN